MSPDGASDDIAAGAASLDRRLPTTLHSDTLKTIARDCGADDCGVISIDAPALDGERGPVLAAFPQARTYLSLIGRMHREPVRSPARSIANLEFHRAGHDINETARRIVRRLEDMEFRPSTLALRFQWSSTISRAAAGWSPTNWSRRQPGWVAWESIAA